MRFLCLSDIHGFAGALGAVLATAERRGYDQILVAGDLCFPGPEPLLTWRRLTQLGAICVQGTGDRAVAVLQPARLEARDDFERRRLRRLAAVRAELGEGILSQLGRLPPIYRRSLGAAGRLTLVHGSPQDPLEPITHDCTDAALLAVLGDEPSDLVLCGGSHVPFDRIVCRPSDEKAGTLIRVINLGSVGDAPTGDCGRFAHATFVESTDDGIEVEQFTVPLGRAA